MLGPLVSIITPAYNAAPYIGETIQSVLDQTYPHWEMLIVDDGSTDNTRDVVVGLRDERIHLIENTHTGLPAAGRNVGLARARGEYIAFLDADDVWMAEKLALQVAYLDKHPDVGLAFTQFYYWFEAYRRLRKKVEPDMRQLPNPGMVFEHLCANNFIFLSTVMLRRSLLDRYGYFDEDLNQRGTEDYEIWLRLAPHTLYGCIQKPLLWYRVRSLSISKNEVAMARGKALAVEKALHRYPEQRERPALAGRRIAARILIWMGYAQLFDGVDDCGRQVLRQAVRTNPFDKDAWMWLVLSFAGYGFVSWLRRFTHQFL